MNTVRYTEVKEIEDFFEFQSDATDQYEMPSPAVNSDYRNTIDSLNKASSKLLKIWVENDGVDSEDVKYIMQVIYYVGNDLQKLRDAIQNYMVGHDTNMFQKDEDE